MLPGPVFNVELLTTARRARYYLVRVLYASILLFVLYQTYSSFFWWRARPGNSYSIREMSNFAKTTFGSIAMSQLIAVLVLTPTLVAGVIADEKQRKTLHYLLASRLTSGEIVLGKLAARLLHVGVFLAIGLPIVSLIGLFGGVDPEFVVLAYAGTFTTAFFLAGISIWVSTTARRVRDAIFAVYLIEIAWLTLPPLAELLRWSWRAGYDWIHPVNEYFLLSNPFYALIQTFAPTMMGGRAVLTGIAWMMGLQSAVSFLCLALAVRRLRPIFRNQSGEVKRGRFFSRLARWRLFRRPACGDDPMLWKERYFVRSAGLVRWLVRLLAAIGGAFLIYYWIDLGWDAFLEVWSYGYGYSGPTSSRDYFNQYLRGTGTTVYVVWILGVAAAAASSVTSEKEEDTWTSLTTTMLTGAEILFAKMVGAAWGPRFLLYTLLFLWTSGLVLGAIHPIGFLALLIELTVFTWFTAALATYISLKSKNTTRATALTMVILTMINVGYMMCCTPFSPDTPLILIPCTPAIILISTIQYDDLWALLQWQTARRMPNSGEFAAASVLGTVVYAVAALVLTVRAFSAFDVAVDRPIRLAWEHGKPIKIADALEE